MIKKKEEEFIIGLEKKAMFTKVNSRLENAMVEVLFGGLMEVGMKVNSEMVCKVGGEFFTGKEDIANMKVTGITVCLMEKGHNTFRMENAMKAHSSKTNFTEKAFFTKMTQSFTEFGKIMSYQ